MMIFIYILRKLKYIHKYDLIFCKLSFDPEAPMLQREGWNKKGKTLTQIL